MLLILANNLTIKNWLTTTVRIKLATAKSIIQVIRHVGHLDKKPECLQADKMVLGNLVQLATMRLVVGLVPDNSTRFRAHQESPVACAAGRNRHEI